MRVLESRRASEPGGVSATNIRNADDMVLAATSDESLQASLDRGSRMGLDIYCDKTVSMATSKKEATSQCCLFIGEDESKQTNSFDYLGSLVTSDGKEVWRRIAMVKDSLGKLKAIFTNGNLSVRPRLLKCYI